MFTGTDELVKKTLDQLKAAQDLSKATTTGLTTATSLQAYDLAEPSKKLYPVLTPLRNVIPRNGGALGNASNWKAISSIGAAGSAFAPEGVRNTNKLQFTEADKSAAYKTWGRDSEVTWEAELQGKGFEDIRALSTLGLMQMVMLDEEDSILGANLSVALGTPGTVVASAITNAASTLTTNATYFVNVVALPYLGYRGSSAPLTISAFRSAIGTQNAAGVSITSGTNMLGATVPAVNGAVAYAWFVGTTTGAANLKLEKITTINSVTFSAPLAGTGPAASTMGADASVDTLGYDGILSQLFVSGSGATITTLATGVAGTGTVLTYDNAGGVTEIDAMLKTLWDNARVGPDMALLNSQEALNINKKVMNAGGQPIFNLNVNNDPSAQAGITASVQVVNYINKFTSKIMKLVVHPTNPPGTVPFLTFNLPEWYPNPEVQGLWDLYLLADYTELVYAAVQRKWEHGVYCRGVMRGFAPVAQGLITNIANG